MLVSLQWNMNVVGAYARHAHLNLRRSVQSSNPANSRWKSESHRQGVDGEGRYNWMSE